MEEPGELGAELPPLPTFGTTAQLERGIEPGRALGVGGVVGRGGRELAVERDGIVHIGQFAGQFEPAEQTHGVAGLELGAPRIMPGDGGQGAAAELDRLAQVGRLPEPLEPA